jgi:hypothetical protein
MIAVELAHRFRRWALLFEQILSQGKARRHLRESAFIRGKPCGVERTHGGKELRAGHDRNSAEVDQRRLLSLRVGGEGRKQQEQSCDERAGRRDFRQVSDQRTSEDS